MTSERVKQIKGSFRLLMDGATAQSMRQKGLDYKLNWGVTIPRLQQMAEDIGHDKDLAIALFKENVRECKILATMIMPPDQMLPELADLWVEQTTSIEVAEQIACSLMAKVSFAANKAFAWIASDNEMFQTTGYLILARLFMNKQEPNERAINEFLDQAAAALQADNLTLKKAAMNSVVKFSQLGLVYQRMAKSALKTINLDFL